MAYVDLNPVRAKIASNIATSRYTSVKPPSQQLLKNPERANQALMSQVSVRSFNFPDISAADFVELVDFTGRELHPGKRGKIEASAPKALTKLGLVDIPTHEKPLFRRMRSHYSGSWEASFMNSDSESWEAS